jgi:tetratricopeptide (TPR) repeat protein
MAETSTSELMRLGYDLHQAGKLQQGCIAYAKALKSDPGNVPLLTLMGIAQQQLEQHDRALNYLSRALKLEPDNAQVLFHQALSLAGKRQWERSIKAYEQVILQQPDHFEAHCNLGNALIRISNYEAALKTYHRGLELWNDSPVLHYNIGVLFQEQMRPLQAIEAYRAAIRLKPNYAAAYSNLSVALCETGQVSEAQVTNDQALKLDPQLAESHFNAHTYFLASEQITQAIACLQRACLRAPDNEKFRFFLGLLFDYTNQTAQASRQFSVKSASREFRSDLQAWQYLKAFNPRPKMLGNAAEVFAFAMGRARTDGLVMEFGVYQGTSIRQIAALTDSTVHGFDSFTGIPEDWNDERAGSYSTEGVLPSVPPNVKLQVGWFSESIPLFIQTHHEPVRLMNIDCDLYSSTKLVLDLLEPQIGPGAVIVFDEFIGNLSWKDDEFKAFHEAASQYGWRFEVLCFCFVTKQVAVLITSG